MYYWNSECSFGDWKSWSLLSSSPHYRPQQDWISALYLQKDSSVVRQTDSRVREEHSRDCSHTWRAAVSDPASSHVSRRSEHMLVKNSAGSGSTEASVNFCVLKRWFLPGPQVKHHCYFSSVTLTCHRDNHRTCTFPLKITTSQCVPRSDCQW